MNVCLNRGLGCGHVTRFNLIKLVSVKNLRLYLSVWFLESCACLGLKRSDGSTKRRNASEKY